MTNGAIRFMVAAVVLCVSFASQAQTKDEEVIFAFTTVRGKHVTLSKGQNDQYIVYRFTNGANIELEFPAERKDSWSKFKYSGYFRPKQGSTEGRDDHFVSFVIGKFEYKIYETTVEPDEKDEADHQVGIDVINKENGSVSNIKGVFSTLKGTLAVFRDSAMTQTQD